MTEDQLKTLFGDLTVVQGLVWLIAAAAFATFVLVFVWPKIAAFVRTADLIASLSTRLVGIESTLERVRTQVENSHSTNLREEQDERHTEIVEELKGIKKDIGRLDERDVTHTRHHANVDRRISDMSSKLDEHLEWAHKQEDRIDGLEDTIDPRKDRP